MHAILLSTLLLLTPWPYGSEPAATGSRGEVVARPVALRRTAPTEQASDMVQVPGGCFQMGSPAREPKRQTHEAQHEVCVETFAIGRFEVTFAEYDRFVESTGYDSGVSGGWWHRLIHNDWGREQRPVIYVSFFDALAYADWLSRETGERYRLPTEAEWEYAARAGLETPFQFGATITAEQANINVTVPYLDNDPTGEFRRQTLPVGQFSPNPWGLYDVHGNVREWTCSRYVPSYDGAERRCADPDSDAPRVVRGGDWYSFPGWARFATRLESAPDTRNSQTGFRLVRDTRGGRLPGQMLRTR